MAAAEVFTATAKSSFNTGNGVAIPPIGTKFKLGTEITAEQKAFLDKYGFLHFDRVATPEEVQMLRSERDRIEREWVAANRKKVFGIPVFYGTKPDGQKFCNRIAFASVFSDKIRTFVHDKRFEPVRKLIGEDARIGDREKDGVVINMYMNIPGSSYPKLGWHTDGLRDIFYGRMPVQMLNIGMHFDDCDRTNGGLRLIPGSHKQGFRDTAFRKLYFVSHDTDPDEICVETNAGDLTVHDGRLWHRVAQSQKIGEPSLRRSMYVPYLTGPYEPKDDNSKTPPYHYLGMAARTFKQTKLKLKKKLGR